MSNLTRSVIFIDQPKAEEKPVEFTHYLNHIRGWVADNDSPSRFRDVTYLGKCAVDGDMFSMFSGNGSIIIYKGHLNSGKY